MPSSSSPSPKTPEQLLSIVRWPLLCLALIVLTYFLPDQTIDPWHAVSPKQLLRLLSLVIAIQWAGHQLSQWLGPRWGLGIAGLFGGFVSSTATIHAMGRQAAHLPLHEHAATAGALLSSLATWAQLALILAWMNPAFLQTLWPGLAVGAICTGLWALTVLYFHWRSGPSQKSLSGTDHFRPAPLSLQHALGFVALLAFFMLLSGALAQHLGQIGIWAGGAVAGFVDGHAPAILVANMVARAEISLQDAQWPVWIGLSTNALSKTIVAWQSGGWRFAAHVAMGQVLALAAMWMVAWV